MQFIFMTAGVLCLMTHAVIAQQLYTDPRGRFHVTVPAGWMAEPAGGTGARVWGGSASCQLEWLETTEDTRVMLSHFLRQVHEQWQDYQTVGM